MKKILLLLSILLMMIVSFNMKNKEIIVDKKEDPVLKLNDSLYIGFPKVSDENFVKKLALDPEYSKVYENIIDSINDKYMLLEKTKIIKEEKINDIIIRLTNKQIRKNNIRIELSTFKDNKKISSILFYNYELDKDKEFDEELSYEAISHLDKDFNLWNLETTTYLSEDALKINKWNKYKIDTKTGEIVQIQKLYPFDKKKMKK